VRDIINGVCYQHYEKHLEQQKGRQMWKFSLQKKIGKRNYCIIKSVIDYCLKSNMDTRRGLTIRLKKLKRRAPDFRVPKILEAWTISSISVSNYLCIFVLVQWTFSYYAGNKRSLYKNDREKLKWTTMCILFLCRRGLVNGTNNVWNKTPESICQITRGQWGTQ